MLLKNAYRRCRPVVVLNGRCRKVGRKAQNAMRKQRRRRSSTPARAGLRRQAGVGAREENAAVSRAACRVTLAEYGVLYVYRYM